MKERWSRRAIQKQEYQTKESISRNRRTPRIPQLQKKTLLETG